MERFLIALDGTPGSLKSIHYLSRVMKGVPHVVLILFHVLPLASRNLLKEEEVRRIEKMVEDRPHLSGLFWSSEDEEQMNRIFDEARKLLTQGSFGEFQITTHFSVESAEIAHVILHEASSLRCSTIVLGRRGLSRVKEFFLGSVSNTVTRQARQMTVWIVDD